MAKVAIGSNATQVVVIPITEDATGATFETFTKAVQFCEAKKYDIFNKETVAELVRLEKESKDALTEHKKEQQPAKPDSDVHPASDEVGKKVMEQVAKEGGVVVDAERTAHTGGRVEAFPSPVLPKPTMPSQNPVVAVPVAPADIPAHNATDAVGQPAAPVASPEPVTVPPDAKAQ